MFPRSPQRMNGRAVILAAIIWKDGDHWFMSSTAAVKQKLKWLIKLYYEGLRLIK